MSLEESAGLRIIPREYPGFRDNLAKKNQPRMVGFLTIGGDGGNRTRVQKPSTDSSTYLVLSFGFNPDDADAHAAAGRVT